MKKTMTRPSKLPPKSQASPTDMVSQVANAMKSVTTAPPVAINPQQALAQASQPRPIAPAPAPTPQRFTPVQPQPMVQQAPAPYAGNSGPAPVNFPANPNPAPKIPKQTGEAGRAGTVNKQPVINIHNYYPQQPQKAKE